MPEIARLSDPLTSLEIEYSRPAMERIRQHAVDGLMALPRVGMGVGGLLLGERKGGSIRVLNSLEIPCSHSDGPSFHLTEAEKKHAAELIATVGQAAVIGWYFSKPRGLTALGEAENALHRELFPGGEQIALVVRPSTVQSTHIAFFFRDRNGGVTKALECDLEEWLPDPAENGANDSRDSGIPFAPEPEPAVAALPETLPAPRETKAEVKTEVKAEPELPPAAPASVPVAAPEMFAFAGVPPKKKGLGRVLTTAAVLAIAVAAIFLAQDYWNPRPPLTLTSTQSDGNLLIRWNVDALRGVDHASMFVNDGGNLQSLPLARYQLDQGVLVYSPKSQRVTAKLSTGDASAIAVWLAPQPEPSVIDTPATLSDATRAAPRPGAIPKTAPVPPPAKR